MNKLVVLLLVATTTLFSASFSKSKKILLKKIYPDNQVTFYCNNPYEIKQVKGKQKALIVKDSRYYTPRNAVTKKGKVNQRAKRVEWEHVMPVPFIFSKYGQEKSLKLYIVKSG